MLEFNKEIILENEIVLLRPLKEEDAEGMAEIALDETIWKFTINNITHKDELLQLIRQSLEERKRNFKYPFTVIDKRSNKIAGSTSFANISVPDKRVEIGWTWYGKEFQGSGLNKACKFLLLQYAFEKMGMERVEFKTDVLNTQSRTALKKIGATEEGILRSHTLMHGWRRRDTLYFSILKNEWKQIKENSLK